MAATALALLIVHHVIDLGQLDVTSYGDRTDFRSTRRSCMLEVSGTANLSELGRRHRDKVVQALQSWVGTFTWSFAHFHRGAIEFASRFTECGDQQMTKRQARPYGERVKELMAEKSRLLSKAQAFEDMGLVETARPLWSCAASYEEPTPLLKHRPGRRLHCTASLPLPASPRPANRAGPRLFTALH